MYKLYMLLQRSSILFTSVVVAASRGGSRILEWGAQVERRRREYRGAEAWVGFWGDLF